MKQNGKLHWLPAWNNIEISANQDIATVVKIQSPQLHEFGDNETLGEKEGLLIFQAQIIRLVKFMGGDWDKDMTKEAAKLAYQEANWMTIAELKFFINRVMCGKYDSHKNFTPAIFMQFLNDFINETLSTRGAVNSYQWRQSPAPDETLFPTHDTTGKEIKYVTPEQVQAAVIQLTKDFALIAEQQELERVRQREARTNALKRNRDLKIIELVEHEILNNRQPDKYLMEAYQKALANIRKDFM